MHSFKPLLEGGQVNEYIEAPKKEEPPHSYDLPDFTPEGDEDTYNAEETNEPMAYDLPGMDESQEPPPEHHIRKHVDVKEKIFLPLVTLDEDEDPIEVVKREVARIRGEAEAYAEELGKQGRELLQKSQEDAAIIMEEARQKREEAKAMLASARAEAPVIKQRAQEEGFNAGYQDGEEQGLVAGKARLEALMADLGQAVKNIEQARNDVAEALNEEIIALIEACVDKLFLTASSVDADLVAQVVSHAVKRLADTSQVIVRLNPGSLEHLEHLAPEAWQKLVNIHGVRWQADASLRPGDCIIDTPITQIDATMDSRRQRIYEMLEDSLRQGEGLDLEKILTEAARKRRGPANLFLEKNQDAATPADDNTLPVELSEMAERPEAETSFDESIDWDEDGLTDMGEEKPDDISPEDDW